MAADRNQKWSAKQIDNGEPIVDVRQFQACTEMLRSGVPWAERLGLRSIFDRYNAWRRVMRKNLVTLAVGATVAIGAFASPTTADAR
jgi:hypothetical protein